MFLGFWILDLEFERDGHEFTNNKSRGSDFSLGTYYFSLIPGHAIRTGFGGFERAEHAAILIATGEAKRNL